MAAPDPYRRIAGIYDRLIGPMQEGVRQKALELLPPDPDWRVLDVGCGTGTGMVPYLRAGCTVAGVDVSPAMLKKAGERLGDRAELHLTDGTTLPFEAGRFDLVTMSMVLHEVPAVARGPLLAEINRVTRPDGRMLIVDFRFGSLRGWRGPVFRAVSAAVERASGHFAGYQSFRTTGGVPGVITAAGLTSSHEKIAAGGNLAIYVVGPQ